MHKTGKVVQSFKTFCNLKVTVTGNKPAVTSTRNIF